MQQPADSTGGLDPLPFHSFPSTELYLGSTLVPSIFPHALLCLQACRASSVGAEETWEDMALVHVFTVPFSFPFFGSEVCELRIGIIALASLYSVMGSVLTAAHQDICAIS